MWRAFVCICFVEGGGLGCPLQPLHPRARARGVPSHLTMYKYPQECALQYNTLESSLRVWASRSPRRNTVTHAWSQGNTSHSCWSNTKPPFSPPTHTCMPHLPLVRARLERASRIADLLATWHRGLLRPLRRRAHTRSENLYLLIHIQHKVIHPWLWLLCVLTRGFFSTLICMWWG